MVALAFAVGSACYAEDAGKANAKAVNTVCPVSGEKIDPSVAPVEAKTKDGKTVEIGVCCNKCPAAIKKNPEAYAEAAVANKKYEEKK
jgi:hypothetical protein